MILNYIWFTKKNSSLSISFKNSNHQDKIGTAFNFEISFLNERTQRLVEVNLKVKQ